MAHLFGKQGYSPMPMAMDPLTTSLQECAHHFIPHVKDGQWAVSIKYGDSYYSIVIGKQPQVYASYTPPGIAAMVSSLKASHESHEKSILGKRPCETENSEPFSYRRTGYDQTENKLYPSLGHEFK